MQSLKSKMIISLIRNRHLFKFKLKPEVVDETFSVTDFREGIAKASVRMNKIPDDMQVKAVDVDGMTGEWIIPENAPQDKVLFYIHGGGFISGDCDSHRMHVMKFTKGTGIKTLHINYRLAPEYPFPGAIDDCVKAYEWLLSEGYKANNIVVGGESAGGTLTLSLLMALKQKGIQYPKAAFSISPVTDLSCQANSFKYNFKKDIAPLNSWIIWTQYYIGDSDITDPLLSPQYGDPTGFPPLFIVIGSNEIHLDDATSFAQKAKEHGVEVDFKVWDGMVHAFPLLAPIFKEATEAMLEICEFIHSKLAE
ncbi:alpha/beta hydrolase [Alkalibacter mobilis]|uniref:alpha/beta hydrolase n=1 Tax=Alkalibacter mobilis TaxID=2787712 RepID=UPI00189DE971|nr:alpha/beta hydrolase [Alkalibacter mobilis]MBF7097871.1 alpha/beta hydrolase [Alkalibacter mobilis]